jgi:hypothetical protein
MGGKGEAFLTTHWSDIGNIAADTGNPSIAFSGKRDTATNKPRTLLKASFRRWY